MKKKIIKIMFIFCSIFILSAFLYFIGFFTSLENKSYDLRVNLFANSKKPSEEIFVVVLDQDSLDWAQEEHGWSWPWPRSAYADIVHYFNSADAYSLSFDVLFTEPSIYGKNDDTTFVQASEEYNSVIQTVFFSDRNSSKTEWPQDIPTSNFTIEGFDQTILQKEGVIQTKALFPIDVLTKSAKNLGSITSTTDKDGVIRRTKFFHSFDGKIVPSLALSAYTAQDDNSKMISYNKKEKEISLMGKTIPAYNDGSVLLRYRESINSYIPYSARDILESKISIDKGEKPLLEPAMFKDGYIFFCFYAPGLFDICTTPLSTSYPGAGVHITALDNLLQNDFIRPQSLIITLLLIAIFSFIGCASQTVSFKLSLFSIPVGIILLLILCAFGYIWGYNISLIAPLFALLTAFVLALIVSYNTEYKQRRYIRDVFKQYLSPVVIEQLIKNEQKVELGGKSKEISIFFSDIEGFTSISEKLSPEELTQFLNTYLTEMTNIILESGGTIDKYEGDAIIAFWNAPVDQENHAEAAVQVAIQCQQKLEVMQAELIKTTNKPIKMRIGLNTGEAVVGNLGSEKRFDYTMIGDAVNLSSRLESLNKQFGTYTMCSEFSKALISKDTDLYFREIAKVIVVGKKKAVTVYEPMKKEKFNKKEAIFNQFSLALTDFYEGKLEAALEKFSAITEKDVAAKNYATKCKELLDSGIKDFDGIWRANEK